MTANSTSFKKGHKGFWLGKKLSVEHKKKLKQKAKRGENNHSWKGDDAGYFAKHSFLKTNFGIATSCDNFTDKVLDFKCKGQSKKFQWSKKQGREYTRDKNDYFNLCVSCHKKYDLTEETINKLKLQGFQKGTVVGIKTQFKKGNTPWNSKTNEKSHKY